MNQPSDNEVRELAYRLWEERGCPADTPEDDWFRAEDELRRIQPPAEGAIFSPTAEPVEE